MLLVLQIGLLVYHQFTSLVDLYPFNGARNYARKEKIIECAVNGVLMSLPPIGFAFHISALEKFGVVYYFVLFAFELTIWWIPYFSVPTGQWRKNYNRLLALATLDFDGGDLYARWYEVYQRLHRGTITVLPIRDGRVVPNLEHTILHAWTVVVAVATLMSSG